RRLLERNQALEHLVKSLQAERAQWERSVEARYNQLLSTITDYTFTVTVQDGKPIHTKHSPNCVAITGYTAQEYDNDPTLWFTMIYPDDREAVMHHIERLLTEQRSEPLEHRIIHKNGSIRWIKNTPVLRIADDGTLIGYDGLISDITERKEAELALRESEERFRFIVEQSPISIAIISLNNRILKANATFCSMLGYSEHEISKLYIQDIMPPEEYRQEKELLRQLSDGTLHEISLEQRYYTRSGDILWVHLHSRYIRDAQGKPLVRVSIVENLTPRKKAEEALRTSEERLSALMQNASDAVVINDAEGIFTYLSPSVGRIFYYSPDMLLGKKAYDYIHPDDLERVVAEFQQLVELPLNAMKIMHYRFRRADGSWAELEAVSTNLLRHKVIRGIITNARDISKRHRDGQDTDED
ncbi:MAG: PAS domain S-box protein, partial [Candidatus Kapabacteria bacterium]|nr:PAS domain S-box protein [Candidatus Kapabacteria bacterium]